MTTLDLTERLHVPSEEDIESCKRLYMTCNNARKTLQGRKTQTRRIMDDDAQEKIRALNGEKTAPKVINGELDPSPLRFFYSEDGHSGEGLYVCLEEYPSEGAWYLGPREYVPGQRRLITTPHWRTNGAAGGGSVAIWDEATRAIRMTEGRTVTDCEPPFYSDDWHQIHASFLMPAWASRILVEITNVWWERVQEISEIDAKREGVQNRTVADGKGHLWKARMIGRPGSYRTTFKVLWNSLHGEGAWGRNDWVRCVEYELITD